VVYVHGFRGCRQDIVPVQDDLLKALKEYYKADEIPYVGVRLRYHGYVGSPSVLQYASPQEYFEDVACAIIYAKRYL